MATGALLFAPRASAAAGNDIFVAKMLTLALALLVHLSGARLGGDPKRPVWLIRTQGVATLVLWFGVAIAGCAFILWE